MPTDSLLVKCRSGVVVYVLLMQEDGSTFELRGPAMFAWLDEFAQHLKIFPKATASSKATSKDYARLMWWLTDATTRKKPVPRTQSAI